MAVISYAHAVVSHRLRSLLSTAERDRGDNPVPTAVIIVGLAILAGVVVAWAVGVADGFMANEGSIPNYTGGEG